MSKHDKKIYIVRGSEDGIIGCYSNKKKAFQKAFEYVSYDSETPIIEIFDKSGELVYKEATYSLFCKEIIPELMSSAEYGSTRATTEMFYLNR